MSITDDHLNISEELPDDKQILLNKLSTIFDSETAADFVCPKTHETRKLVTIDDLKHANYEQPDERLQRLRSMVHYQTTTQSLARADLEASYQSFVRSQVGQQQCSRGELEQFVRNNSDIDAAKRYLDSAHDVSSYPLQSHLLFHSSKLNEQRANLLKSASTKKSLKELNDGFSLQEYFPETFITHTKSAHKQREIVDHKPHYSRPHSIHIEHRDKKYRITFLKDSKTIQCLPKLSRYSTNNQNLLLMNHRNADSLFGTESSTMHGLSTESNTSNIHREIFPPLSLSALREYRPTLIPKSSSASTNHSQQRQQQQQQPSRKAMQKTEFIWEQSIVPPKT